MNEKKKLTAAEKNELYRAQEAFHANDAAFKKYDNIDFFLYLAVVLVIALSIRLFIFEPVRVEGPSMEPTLFTNERMFVEKVSYWFDEPERAQIIICRYPDEKENCVKRVIALPGERVRISWGVIFVNDVAIDESAYWNDFIFGDMEEITVPERHVFVMGDNRNVSKDSRAPSVGAIPYGRIVGRAHFVMWPIKNYRKI